MKTTILGCVFFLLSSMDIDHGIYLSVMEITHADLRQSEMVIKVFEDDFEIALHHYVGMDIDSTTGLVANDSLVQSYFDHYVHISIDSIQLSHVYQSKEKENDSYWLTFTIDIPKDGPALKVHASYFMEIYPDQSNIVKFKSQGQQQFLRLTRKSKEGSFSLSRH